MHLSFPFEDEKINPSSWKDAYSEVHNYEATFRGSSTIGAICFLLRDMKQEKKSMEESFILIIENEVVIYNLLGKKRAPRDVSLWHRAIISYCISIVYKEEYAYAFPTFTRSEIEKIIF